MTNAAIILDAVRNGKGNASKKEIQEITGIAWGTMCKTVDSLTAGGFLFSRKEKSKGRGRPTIPLCVNQDAAYYVGIDVGAAHTRAVVCSLAFNMLSMKEVATPRYTDKESFCSFVDGIIEDIIAASRIDRERLAGIGVAISGRVDYDNGVIYSAGNIGLNRGEDIHIGDMLKEKYGIDVYCLTTQSAAAAAEYNFGAMSGCQNLLTVGLGVGIGSGVISEGQLLMSMPNRPVGYVGHLLVSGNKRICSCGYRGCLESYSGGSSLVGVAAEEFPDRKEFSSAEGIDRLAAAGDPDAMEIMDKAASYNAVALSTMILFYIPDAVVFSGGQSVANGYLFTKTIEEIRNFLPPERLRNIKMSITTLGKYQSALGAARLVYEKYFGEIKK